MHCTQRWPKVQLDLLPRLYLLKCLLTWLLWGGAILLSPWTGAILIRVKQNAKLTQSVVRTLRHCFMVYFRCCSETNEFAIAAAICAKVMLLCSMNEIFILNSEIQDVEHV